MEREAIYFRDDKKCLVCGITVVWSDVEIHHVKPHSQGGKTVLENGALVHKNCHPKSKEAVAKYAESFKEKKTMFGSRTSGKESLKIDGDQNICRKVPKLGHFMEGKHIGRK